MLPVLFFAHSDPLHFTLPPSPQITLALLPYFRSFYNHMWKKYITPYETRWIREVTPRFALESEAMRQQQQQQQQPRNNRHQNGRRRNNNNNQNRRGAAAAAQQQQQPAQAEIQIEREWNGEVLVENHNVMVQGNNLTTLVLGALLWPSVARLAGQGIVGKWPAQWGGEKVRKWLPSLLARNLVGGVLVVVVKVCFWLLCSLSFSFFLSLCFIWVCVFWGMGGCGRGWGDWKQCWRQRKRRILLTI